MKAFTTISLLYILYNQVADAGSLRGSSSSTSKNDSSSSSAATNLPTTTTTTGDDENYYGSDDIKKQLEASLGDYFDALNSTTDNNLDDTTSMDFSSDSSLMLNSVAASTPFQEYNDLVIAVIKLDQPADGLGDGDQVTFSEANSDQASTKAVYLKDVTAGDNGDEGTYKATYVDPSQAFQMVNQTGLNPFFYVHGWSVKINDALDATRSLKESSQFQQKNNYYPVPVVWPTQATSNNPVTALSNDPQQYKHDQHTAAQVGPLFAALDMSGMPDEKAMMMHSMGNHMVVSAFASTFNAKFQDIFMVASDVPADMFSTNPSNNDEYGNYKVKAQNMVNALTDDGKITIFNRDTDHALQASPVMNHGIQRLGLDGPTPTAINAAYGDKVVTVDVSEESIPKFTLAWVTQHTYEFETFMLNDYEARFN